MKIENWLLKDLHEYANNPRKNDHAVEAVSKAITAYGFKVPILAKSTGEIIDGHLRYKAAKHAGLTSVPVLVADDLSDDEVRAFRVSVNKVAELAKWDMSILQEELQYLYDEDVDLSTIGFSEVELDDMLGLSGGSSSDPDNVPESVPVVARQGDLWQLGDHFLLVGDAIQQESYQCLLGGGADMVWTDPPYNVDYSSKAGKIKNDKMSPQQFADFLAAFYGCIYGALRPGAPVYVAHADGQPGQIFRSKFVEAGLYFSACLIWRKSQATLGRSDYQYQHEPILYGWKPGAAHSWYGGRKRKTIVDLTDAGLFEKIDEQTYQIDIGGEILVVTGKDVEVRSVVPTIISVDKPLQSKEHPTMKPVALVEHFLINSSQPGDVVLDPFAGSGTTLIACEARGRKARCVELDEKYASTILTRWQGYTGKIASLVGGASYQELVATRCGNAEKN